MSVNLDTQASRLLLELVSVSQAAVEPDKDRTRILTSSFLLHCRHFQRNYECDASKIFNYKRLSTVGQVDRDLIGSLIKPLRIFQEHYEVSECPHKKRYVMAQLLIVNLEKLQSNLVAKKIKKEKMPHRTNSFIIHA